ncbi:MAG: CopG family transcriptional regulator [Thaumarchaeota archaeon]|jgi:metal-responsive CopG/Arc/MetJ family transcriptional regulator|nr:CopG family transcriptional regulator [Nitrososphaerota archaeon]MBT5842096.1 CopG family transcriptional regulator [Nitrososphaerota archaeon]MBT6468351.1 CopG family transcriptional regulator [Nitrososphaerota archaeon]
MKVVGAKLDDSDYERFETFCIDEGISKSEVIRGLIKQYCDACNDDQEIQLEIQKPTVTIIDEKQPSQVRNIKIVDF